jgi:hypothetical protein
VGGQPSERGLQGRDAVVVEVPGHPACEHPSHAHRPVPAFKQVDAERGITLRGELAADVPDVVVQSGGLVDDNHARIWSRAVGKGQI